MRKVEQTISVKQIGIKVQLDYLGYCDEFENKFKAKIIQRKKKPSLSPLWQMGKDEYNWTCLEGCPPGFHCDGDKMSVCPTGASDMETKSCTHCEPGFVCKPGTLPYPCPLGQYVFVKNKDFSANLADREFKSMKTYECHDCPRKCKSPYTTEHLS